jgi:hypothetical protein
MELQKQKVTGNYFKENIWRKQYTILSKEEYSTSEGP